MGKTHAKWSPVATAWYRMLPEVLWILSSPSSCILIFFKEFVSYLLSMQVVLLQEIEDEMAEELVQKCPVNVFDIEDIAKGRMMSFFNICSV